MNTTITEKELLQALDIPDWRHMSKDKIITFASSMPYLDPNVAKTAINQFPNFTKMSCEIVSNCKDYFELVNEENTEASKQVYEVNMRILDDLERRLNKRFLFPGERQKIIDGMIEISKNISDLEKENKNFRLKALKSLGNIAIGTCAIGAAILGVRIKK